jgi:hypothetical protein
MTSTPASDTAMLSILLLFRPLADPPVTGKSTGGVAVGAAVGGTDVAVRLGLTVGGMDVAVAVGGMDVAVAVGGVVGVSVKPADTGTTCQTMAPRTNRIKIPVTLLDINFGTIDNLLSFHDVLQFSRVIDLSYKEHPLTTSSSWGVFISASWGRKSNGKGLLGDELTTYG